MPWEVKQGEMMRILFSCHDLGSSRQEGVHIAVKCKRRWLYEIIFAAVCLAPLCDGYRVHLSFSLIASFCSVILNPGCESALWRHVFVCINSALVLTCATFRPNDRWTAHLPHPYAARSCSLFHEISNLLRTRNQWTCAHALIQRLTKNVRHFGPMRDEVHTCHI